MNNGSLNYLKQIKTPKWRFSKGAALRVVPFARRPFSTGAALQRVAPDRKSNHLLTESYLLIDGFFCFAQMLDCAGCLFVLYFPYK
jgi:hypothetical protein